MLSKLRAFTEKIENASIDGIIMRLFATWCLTSFLLLVGAGSYYNLSDYESVSLIVFAVLFVIIFAVLSLIKLKNKKTDIVMLPLSFLVYSLAVIMQSSGKPDMYVALLFTVLAIIMILYYEKNGMLGFKSDFSTKKRNTLIIVAVAFFVVIVGAVGLCRYLAYLAPNYDFGIFSQMFYNMKEHFTPVTTVERDKLLSHFAIHVSPIYYVLLPLYFIFPSPATLQISQTLVLASAAVPAYLIAKKYELSNSKCVAVVVMTLFQPVVSCGTLYDLHENCFLFPLLLWVFWAFEREKYALLAVFTLLTLAVKEDAAVYIIFFGIFVILSRRKYLSGLSLVLAAGVWFGVVTYLLTKYGNGVMSSRYDNYITASDGGLLEVVKNILVDPAYVFTQVFKDEHGDYGKKMQFLVQLLAPTVLLPFATKKVSRLTLLLPSFLLSFMTVYAYQYDIRFQYAFGSAAFITYLAIMNLAQLKPSTQRVMSVAAVVCSFFMFMGLFYPEFVSYVGQYRANREDVKIINEVLESIPEDSSVCASTYFIPKLSEREELYEIYYHTPRDGEVLDYVIFDTRFDYSTYLEKYEALGYEVTRVEQNSDGKNVITVLQPSEKTGTVEATGEWIEQTAPAIPENAGT